MMHLSWTTSEWLSLSEIERSRLDVFGVYIIWHGGPAPRVVYIGHGNIAQRLKAHGDDPVVLAYRVYGELLVTWAGVPMEMIDGIEKYLSSRWPELIRDELLDVAPIVVNVPALTAAP